MYLSVQVQGYAFFPQTIDSIASDVSAQIQQDGLTVQAFAINHPDRLTQIAELQFIRFTYAATVQVVAGDQFDPDGATSVIVDAFTSVTGNTPSAVKTSAASVTDPGGGPSVPTGGWDVLTGLHADARVLIVGVLVLAGLAIVFVGRNVHVGV